MKSCFHSLSRLFSEKPKQMCLFIGICVIFLALVLLFFGIFFFRNQAEEPASSPQTSESVLFPQTKEETASFENAPTTDSSPVFSPEPSINGETEQEKEPISPKALSHGIDVSKWQGVIDWAKVKESKTVDFAMIRVGYRAANGNIEKDEYADYNLQQAENSGILTGAYFYSGADSQKEALREAQWLLDAIAGYAISYPVVLDFEIGSAASHLTAKSRTDLALSFLREIQKAGYEAMLYAPIAEFENPSLWETSRILSEFPVWIAHYSTPAYPDVAYPETSLSYAMWQYSDRGEVFGVKEKVDLNAAYFERTKQEAKDPSKRPQNQEQPEEFVQNFSPVTKRVTAKEETNLRAIPSIDGTIVAVLKKGEFLNCTGESDMGWSRLEWNGENVYAVTSLLTTTVIETPTDPAEGHTFTPIRQSVTAKEEVNLRLAPTTDGEIAYLLKHGENVIRTGIGDKGWSRLEWNGKTVYAVTSYLIESEPEAEEAVP